MCDGNVPPERSPGQRPVKGVRRDALLKPSELRGALPSRVRGTSALHWHSLQWPEEGSGTGTDLEVQPAPTRTSRVSTPSFGL